MNEWCVGTFDSAARPHAIAVSVVFYNTFYCYLLTIYGVDGDYICFCPSHRGLERIAYSSCSLC